MIRNHLRGTATISGLDLFREHPAGADPELGPDGFKSTSSAVTTRPQLPGKRRTPCSRASRQIEPPDDEILAADVLLVPTPLNTGPRSRIITGMTFGTCVVAHEANRLGIPELRHDENALLAADGPRLAEATLAALSDPETRARVGREGRRLYESTFTPSIAGARIVRELERVAAEAGEAAVAVP